jgi:hypothetical protein
MRFACVLVGRSGELHHHLAGVVDCSAPTAVITPSKSALIRVAADRRSVRYACGGVSAQRRLRSELSRCRRPAVQRLALRASVARTSWLGLGRRDICLRSVGGSKIRAEPAAASTPTLRRRQARQHRPRRGMTMLVARFHFAYSRTIIMNILGSTTTVRAERRPPLAFRPCSLKHTRSAEKPKVAWLIS